MTFRIDFELETREKELQTLREQLDGIQAFFSACKEGNASLADRIDAIGNECSAIEQECIEILISSTASETSGGVAQRNASGWKFQFPAMKDQAWIKADQRLLSEISGKSSALGELMTRACEMEMARTRSMDELLERAEEARDMKVKQMSEISALLSEMESLRKDYDMQLVDDFQCLSDLALTVESLAKELEKEVLSVNGRKKRVPKNSSVVVPIRESSLQLQEEVIRLEQELAAKQEYYERELQRAQSELHATKSRKIKLKSNFQQNLKGLFKDFEFLTERTDKAEAALEKAHLHHQLNENEIIAVVSPIIDRIDQVRERIQLLASDAEQALYGEEANFSQTLS